MLAFAKREEDKKKKDDDPLISKLGRLLLGNTSKLANTTAGGVALTGDLVKAISGRVTGNKEAERNALNAKSGDKYLKEGGGLFGTGGFVNSGEEAGNLSAEDVAKKSVGGGLGVFSEVVPVGRGINIASKGGKFAKALTEGAVMGGVGSTGEQLADEGNVDIQESLKSALLGGAMGGAGFGLEKGGRAAVKSAKTIAKDQRGMVKLPGGGQSDDVKDYIMYHGTKADIDKLSKASPTKYGDPEALYGPGLYMTNDRSIADSYSKTKGAGEKGRVLSAKVGKDINLLDLDKKLPDDVADTINAYINKPQAYESEVEKMLREKLQKLGEYDTNVKGKTGAEAVKMFQQALEEQGVGKYDASTAFYDLQRSLKDSHKFDGFKHVGGVGKGKEHGVNILFDYGDESKFPIEDVNDTPDVLPEQTPETVNAAENQQFDDLEAQGGRTISQESAVEPTPSPSRLNMVERKLKTQNVAPTAPTTPKTGAQVAKEALPESIQKNLDDDVIDLLSKTGKDKDAAAKAPVFEGARDPASVLGRQLGSVGTDIVNDSAQAFKRRSDLQDSASSLITDAQKKLKKAAKTPVGRADLESRINNALEDRANADSYFKNPKEKEVYEATKKFYDYYQAELELAGKGTLENYSPRVARRDATHAADNLDFTVNKAFSTNADAPFLKERKKEDTEIDNLDSPVSIMQNYSSAVSKQLAYEDMLAKLPERLKSVNPIYTLDNNTKQSANKYLQKYLQDQLQPDIPTSGKGLGKLVSEKTQNKLIANTYSAALKFSPKYYLMNRSQGYATKSQVSKEAMRLSKAMRKDPEWKELQKGLSSGDSTTSAEARQATDGGLGRSKSKIDRLDAKLSREQGNVNDAFNAGVAENVVNSRQYGEFRKQGMTRAQAAKATLADEDFSKDLAVRQGNVVTNTTQFGGNIANKPAWLRDSGTIMGFSKKWYQQYQRFPLGMMQMLGNITDPKTAQAIDIMRRGDPRQTKLVDYSKAVKILKNAIPDAEKAVKAGESTVSKAQLAKSKKLLDQMQKTLDAEIKKNSSIRRGKTAKNVGKMWASASIIQYLFSEVSGLNEGKSDEAKVGNAIKYGAPVNVPTKDQNPLTGAVAPSLPVDKTGISERKLLNFIPVVGPVVNRGRDVKNFVGALTGE